MMIQSIHKGRTMTDVCYLDGGNDTDMDLFISARGHAGETNSSLFGFDVKRYDDGSVVVTLYTD